MTLLQGDNCSNYSDVKLVTVLYSESGVNVSVVTNGELGNVQSFA